MKKWKIAIIFIVFASTLYYFYAYHREMRYARNFCNKYYMYIPSMSDGRGAYHMISVYGQKFETRNDAIESCMEFHKSQFDIRYSHLNWEK